jgi:hypothetical protein
MLLCWYASYAACTGRCDALSSSVHMNQVVGDTSRSPGETLLPSSRAMSCLLPTWYMLLNASLSMARLRSNSAVLTLCHWKGVCGLGVKLLMVTCTAMNHLPSLWGRGACTPVMSCGLVGVTCIAM